MHNAWMRFNCGRLKSDYQYSISIVYNNFPWPELLKKESKMAIASVSIAYTAIEKCSKNRAGRAGKAPNGGQFGEFGGFVRPADHAACAAQSAPKAGRCRGQSLRTPRRQKSLQIRRRTRRLPV